LASIADWLDPIKAPELFDRASRALTIARDKAAADPDTYYKLDSEIVAVATVMKRADGARVMMARVSGSREWTSRLVSLARRMTPSGADELCTEAIRRLLKQHREPSPAIAFLLYKINRGKATEIALELARSMLSGKDIQSWNDDFGGETELDAALSDSDRLPVFVFFSRLARERGEWKDPMKSDKSPPCRLTTQELVDLLKMPTCIGKARRVVLDHLGNIHGQRFTNHWEFVRFAREKRLQLDVTTPPHRPDPQESIKRMLAILELKS